MLIFIHEMAYISPQMDAPFYLHHVGFSSIPQKMCKFYYHFLIVWDQQFGILKMRSNRTSAKYIIVYTYLAWIHPQNFDFVFFLSGKRVAKRLILRLFYVR